MHLSPQALSAMLRASSNRLEMLLRPDEPHHEDDAERQRIQMLGTEERARLHRDSVKIIHEVRAEFRRRLDDGQSTLPFLSSK